MLPEHQNVHTRPLLRNVSRPPNPPTASKASTLGSGTSAGVMGVMVGAEIVGSLLQYEDMATSLTVRVAEFRSRSRKPY